MEFDSVHKALSNEVRQRILLSLAKRDKYLSEIALEIHHAPQTTDFHLNMLVNIGLVSSEWRSGRKYYHLKDKKIISFLRERRPVPPEIGPKPPHEIMIDAWRDLGKRLDIIEGKIDRLQKEIEKKSSK